MAPPNYQSGNRPTNAGVYQPTHLPTIQSISLPIKLPSVFIDKLNYRRINLTCVDIDLLAYRSTNSPPYQPRIVSVGLAVGLQRIAPPTYRRTARPTGLTVYRSTKYTTWFTIVAAYRPIDLPPYRSPGYQPTYQSSSLLDRAPIHLSIYHFTDLPTDV